MIKPQRGAVCKTCVLQLGFLFSTILVDFLQVGTGHGCVGVLVAPNQLLSVCEPLTAAI